MKTVSQFRDLLKSYLTEPEYAAVELRGEAALIASLDDGSRFLVRVEVSRGGACDRAGVEWARLSDLKEHYAIRLDDGFTCAHAGIRPVRRDDNGLYFACDEGKHYLDGQADDGDHLVGIYLA